MYIKRFHADDAGMSSLMFALMLPIVLAMGGAAVDYTRAYALRAELSRSAEGAVLAAASLSNTRDPELVIQEYFDLNLSSFADEATIMATPTVTKQLNNSTIELTVEANLPTYFLSLVGIDDMRMTTYARAQESRQNLEIALVMDISSSMGGSKLRNLKTAAEDFVDIMFERDTADLTSLSLVPFGGTVNIGDDLFDHFVLPTGSADVDPDQNAYDIGDDILDSDFRFSNGETCVETTHEEFEDDSRPDEGVAAQLPDLWVWNRNNPWCPPDQAAAVFNSGSSLDLNAHIRDMVLSDGTGMDIGALWGYRALSPAWRGLLGGDFGDRPNEYNSDSIKILIIMTDGEITAQYRPRDPSNIHARHSNQQTIVPKGGKNDPAGADSAIGNFRIVCDNAKANGVIVYTIGFQIRTNRVSHQLLGECASGIGRYYFVESLDISAAFESIAASINSLRVSG